jgi:hypothetical protein
MDRDLRLNLLLRELDRCGAATLRLENGQLHVEHGDKLTAALCDEITEMRVELSTTCARRARKFSMTRSSAPTATCTLCRVLPRKWISSGRTLHAPGKAHDAAIKVARSW